LEPGEEAPPGYEAKDRKYYGKRPDRAGKSKVQWSCYWDLTPLQITSPILLHLVAKERSSLLPKSLFEAHLHNILCSRSLVKLD
jgi:hypothetical protein